MDNRYKASIIQPISEYPSFRSYMAMTFCDHREVSRHPEDTLKSPLHKQLQRNHYGLLAVLSCNDTAILSFTTHPGECSDALRRT